MCPHGQIQSHPARRGGRRPGHFACFCGVGLHRPAADGADALQSRSGQGERLVTDACGWRANVRPPSDRVRPAGGSAWTCSLVITAQQHGSRRSIPTEDALRKGSISSSALRSTTPARAITPRRVGEWSRAGRAVPTAGSEQQIPALKVGGPRVATPTHHPDPSAQARRQERAKKGGQRAGWTGGPGGLRSHLDR